MKKQIIRFLIASGIFLGFIFVGIGLDALFYYVLDMNMPIVFYYFLGWIGSGTYLLLTIPEKPKDESENK